MVSKLGENYIHKMIKVKQIRIASAFVQGRGHLSKKIPCQDRVYSSRKNTVATIALADGAGSCMYSDKGAEIVTKEISKIINSVFNGIFDNKIDTQKYIISSLTRKLLEYSKRNSISIKELSSTLLFVSIKDNRYIAGHIGDGVIGYKNIKNNINVLSHPDNGEYSNSTYFVTSPNAHKYLRIYKGNLNEIDSFILMSDGSEESLYDKRNKFLSPANLQMIKWLDNNSSKEVSKALKMNLNHSIKMRTFDDCSLGIIKISETKLQNIIDFNISLQKEILDENNKTYVKNDVKIIDAIINNKQKKINEISKFTKLSKRTVNKHLRKLKQKRILNLDKV